LRLRKKSHGPFSASKFATFLIEDTRSIERLPAPKSLAIAYLIWTFGGLLGLHRIYLGMYKVGLSWFATSCAIVAVGIFFSGERAYLLGMIILAFLVNRSFFNTKSHW